MLSHIIALTILLLSLLAAGVPAFACGEVVPTRDFSALILTMLVIPAVYLLWHRRELRGAKQNPV